MGARVCRPVPAELTTLEMLDALEDCLLSLRPESPVARVSVPETVRCDRPVAVAAALARSGLAPGWFASAFGVDRATLDQWIGGTAAAPEWVEGALRLIELLPPSAQRRLAVVRTPAAVRSHPFARIEDL